MLGYIRRGIEEGATLGLGGGRPKHLKKGWYAEPTLFTDVDNSMTIAPSDRLLTEDRRRANWLRLNN